MLDFVDIRVVDIIKNGRVSHKEVVPEFKVDKPSKDLMIKGGAFYAVWDESNNIWSKEEQTVQQLVDTMVQEKFDEVSNKTSITVKPIFIKYFSTKKWLEWKSFVRSLQDNYHDLDREIKFANDMITKGDYVSRVLDYSMAPGRIDNYEELMSTLYSPSERQKLEWAIGSIIAGDSRWIQKLIVLYGGPGTGKSTVINLIQELFNGYYCVFDSRALGSSNSSFALEPFRENPLIAIQHDGDLSKIDDNTRLNSIVSHENMLMNEKFKSLYKMTIESFLIMATNKPVKITDAKSGILRRLIDVVPTGMKIPTDRFQTIQRGLKFEYGAIADYCYRLYLKLGPNFYDGYVPLSMMSTTNDFYNFIEDNYEFLVFESPEGVTLATMWKRYKDWCDEVNLGYTMKQRVFKEELKNYFKTFEERYNGQRSVYKEFLKYKLGIIPDRHDDWNHTKEEKSTWIELKDQESLLDIVLSNEKAQGTKNDGSPKKKWERVQTRLVDVNTRELHYVKVPKNMIVIDFDIRNEEGQKDFEANLRAASSWPQTYVETSKSGGGLHLHYYYNGDTEKLSRIYAPNVEVLVFKGDASLRRKLSICNDLPIATINSGLPMKEVIDKSMVTDKQIKSERSLRELIKRNLNKEIHNNTTQSVAFIKQILDEAYNSGMTYDVEDLKTAVVRFASSSSHQAIKCLQMVNKMRFKSEERDNEEVEKLGDSSEAPIVFFDVEVFPNLFVVCWKIHGVDEVVSWINPTPEDIELLVKYRLIGFFNKDYDNHILYARMMGYSNEQLYEYSCALTSQDKSVIKRYFLEAYNLSYTDVYDFLSAAKKMSLKKWEIKLGIKHHELGLPWNQPVDEDKWPLVAEYCCDDVRATEAVFDANPGDWKAREILAVMSGLTVNDRTNKHTTRIMIGKDRNPFSKYVYTDLSTIFPGYEFSDVGFPEEKYIPGTKIVSGKSYYRGEDPGEGGYVYAKPGIYYNIGLLDVASMHPSSMLFLKIFGIYTERLRNLVEARKAIKHGDLEAAKDILNEFGVGEFLNDPEDSKSLSDALKTAINSLYGLTSAKFENLLRDPRNIDNIVAKYGALFMINLKHEVLARGYEVIHIKTDSIKIANIDDDIVDFIMSYGQQYGFTFEYEAFYDRMCLVNDAVYVAKYKEPVIDKKTGMEHWWTATGAQFIEPYVFKTLFSKEPIKFEDMCQTKSVQSALYLDFGTEEEPDRRFVGRVGQFCPMLKPAPAGILLRQDKDDPDKFSAATGTKNKSGGVYYWMESEVVRELKLEDLIDVSYFGELVDSAIDNISQFGDFYEFAS